MPRRLMLALMRRSPALGRRLAFARTCLAARRRGQGQAGRARAQPRMAPVRVMGLAFANPLGIAAGFDKRGQLGRQAGALGFGAIEIGTLTPPQAAAWGAGQAAAAGGGAVLGVSLGMAADTEPGAAVDDYLAGMCSAWAHADYLTINLCSPQAGALLAPACREWLEALLVALKQQQRDLAALTGRQVPLAVKLRLPLAGQALPAVASRLAALRFDALVAAFDLGPPATPQRYLDWQTPERQRQACIQVSRLAAALAGRLPIISVGGICSAAQVAARLQAGAALVQLHDALVYEGPLVARALQPSPSVTA
ncbi:hypothetical protein [Halomonas sp. E14]|uniref:hypothetical protein n=1 Tax=Halomonas sp. E14 TaxID=3397245 RepID=UPI00403EACD8